MSAENENQHWALRIQPIVTVRMNMLVFGSIGKMFMQGVCDYQWL